MSKDREKSGSQRARALQAGCLAGHGLRYEHIARHLGVSAGTVENYKREQPDAWGEGFLAGMAEMEARLVPIALAKQEGLLESEREEIVARVAADIRSGYDRNLDRAVKRDEIVQHVVELAMTGTIEAVIAAVLPFVPEERRGECERAARAAVAIGPRS